MKSLIKILEYLIEFLGFLEKKVHNLIDYIENFNQYLEARKQLGKYYRYEDITIREGKTMFSHVILCHVTGVRKDVKKLDWDDDHRTQSLYQKGFYFSYFEQDGVRSKCDEFGEETERGLMDDHMGDDHKYIEISKADFEVELQAQKNYPTVKEYIATRDNTKAE